MNLTDFYFLCMFALILIIYYIVPKKLQFAVLLVSSIAYYLFSGNGVAILYPVISILMCYCISRGFLSLNHSLELALEDAKDNKELIKELQKKNSRRKSVLLAVGIILLLAVLILLKYLRFSSASDILVPLGLSYYTFTLIGYVVDVYYGIASPQKNLLKLMAFGLYFPTLVSGPIMQYREVEESFFAPHSLDYHNLTYGLQRMLWGFFKKLVIAERMGKIVGTVFGDPATFGGIYVWFAILCFTFQLYTDFSGLMDIVIGISQCFGITVPENFKTPFFSKSISEYWRRWHITLGVWMKEYVFYRVLRTGAYSKLQKKFKDKFGKKRGKQLATFVAMFILWLVVGLWHGGNMTYVIGSGLLHWFYIVMEELLEPVFTNLWKKKNIDVHAKWLERTRIARTFILVNIGNAFFRSASVKSAIVMFGYGFSKSMSKDFFSGGVFNLGLNWIECGIAVASLIILLVVSLLQEKIDNGGYAAVTCVRDLIATKPVVLRFIIWFALLFYVILLGQYGPGYSAAEFIYQGF